MLLWVIFYIKKAKKIMTKNFQLTQFANLNGKNWHNIYQFVDENSK